MRTLTVVLAVVGFVLAVHSACAQEKSEPQQIGEAVSALPEDLRDDAGVLGYRGAELVTLRPAVNGMLCLADDPSDDRLHVACYHESLEPFMARGRQLRDEGKTRAEVQEARLAEIEAGTLPVPERWAALYTLTGGTFDPQSNTITGGRGNYVIYVPYATQATLGISEQPSRDRPWLMNPGTPWAHVMIGG